MDVAKGGMRWAMSNTTARHWYRITDSLRLWRDQCLLGPGIFEQKDWDVRARRALHEAGLSQGNSPSAARKIIGPAQYYGFVVPRLPKDYLVGPLAHWNKAAGSLTQAGECLLAAGTDEERQSCYRNALALRVLPSPMEPEWRGEAFCPFQYVLAVLFEMERVQTTPGNQACVSNIEIASVLQVSDPSVGVEHAATQILAMHHALSDKTTKRKYARAVTGRLANATQRHIKPESVTTYASVVADFCVETGLCERRSARAGAPIMLTRDPHGREIARAIATRPAPVSGLAHSYDYLLGLTSGEMSWTLGRSDPAPGADTTEVRDKATQRLVGLLRKVVDDLLQGGLDLQDVRRTETVDPEVLKAEQLELQNPVDHWDKVREFLTVVCQGGQTGIPALQPSAIFEWCLFRAGALLAGPGNLSGPVRNMRNFGIAADLMPVSHARPGEPDICLHLRGGLILPIEGTLTSGSRQVATEAESVRRHVAAQGRLHAPGRVIGLFVAPAIDFNLLEWFKPGTHWLPDGAGEKKFASDIVPLSVGQVIQLGDAAARHGGGQHGWLQGLLEGCLACRQSSEKEWLASMATLVDDEVARLLAQPAVPVIPAKKPATSAVAVGITSSPGNSLQRDLFAA